MPEIAWKDKDTRCLHNKYPPTLLEVTHKDGDLTKIGESPESTSCIFSSLDCHIYFIALVLFFNCFPLQLSQQQVLTNDA
jgi:hypothetical protein